MRNKRLAKRVLPLLLAAIVLAASCLPVRADGDGGDRGGRIG